MQNPHRSNIAAIARLVGAIILVLLVGVVLLFQFHSGVVSGELAAPRKYSSSPSVMVSPMHGAMFYYGLLIFYAVTGSACIAMPFIGVRKFLRADPIRRETMLFSFRPSKARSSVNVWRSLFLFVVVPFVIFGFLFFFMVVGKP